MSDEESASDEKAVVLPREERLCVTAHRKRKYPYGAILMIMMATVGLG